MATLHWTMTTLNWFKSFFLETLAAFGIITVLRAAMVPPTLSKQ